MFCVDHQIELPYILHALLVSKVSHSLSGVQLRSEKYVCMSMVIGNCTSLLWYNSLCSPHFVLYEDFTLFTPFPA